jgi:amidase
MFQEYADYDATGLAGLVAKGEVTAAELVEAAWARIAAGEPKINAISQDLREPAARQIAGGVSGPFAGVPFLLKDLDMDYAGAKLTMGCVAAKDYRPARNAELVNRCLKAGLVIIGSTTTPELGLKATTETALHGAGTCRWRGRRMAAGRSGFRRRSMGCLG